MLLLFCLFHAVNCKALAVLAHHFVLMLYPYLRKSLIHWLLVEWFTKFIGYLKKEGRLPETFAIRFVVHFVAVLHVSVVSILAIFQ